MENTNLNRQQILEKLINGDVFNAPNTSSMNYCEPISVNEEENELIVLYVMKSGYAFESEFELDMTLNGFEIGEYKFI